MLTLSRVQFALTVMFHYLFPPLSIGPLWDGNEVWLVVLGGALFAAFPEAYATAFSGFYLPFMVLLFALIFRGVSMEFRGKREGRLWRQAWDVAFCAASTLATFLFGVAVGNTLRGMPINAGTLVDLLWPPYPLLVGAFAVATFAMHGSIYLCLKTGWLGRPFYAFLSSSFTIAAFTALFGLSLFPNLICTNLPGGADLTVYNAAASEKTLGIMAVIALLGMPFVLSYTVVIYWVFRGKVQLGKYSC